MKRLYIAVRSDIPPGLQIAQACHAARAFTLEHPSADVGENLVVLASESEAELRELAERLSPLPTTRFFEPDLQGELTAIAFPGEGARAVSSLPLALRARATLTVSGLPSADAGAPVSGFCSELRI